MVSCLFKAHIERGNGVVAHIRLQAQIAQTCCRENRLNVVETVPDFGRFFCVRQQAQLERNLQQDEVLISLQFSIGILIFDTQTPRQSEIRTLKNHETPSDMDKLSSKNKQPDLKGD